MKLVIGDATVPIGAYTRQVLANLKLTGALKNVKSNETDVKQVVAKVALDEADAGFVYVADVRTVKNTRGALRRERSSQAMAVSGATRGTLAGARSRGRVAPGGGGPCRR